MFIKHNACTSETIVFPIPLFSQGTCFTIKTSRLCKYRKHSSLQIQVLMVFVAKKKWYKNLVKIYPNIHQGIMDPNIFNIRILSSVLKWHLLKRFFFWISRLNKKSNITLKRIQPHCAFQGESLSSIDPQPKVTQCGVVHIILSQHEVLCVYKIPTFSLRFLSLNTVI